MLEMCVFGFWVRAPHYFDRQKESINKVIDGSSISLFLLSSTLTSLKNQNLIHILDIMNRKAPMKTQEFNLLPFDTKPCQCDGCQFVYASIPSRPNLRIESDQKQSDGQQSDQFVSGSATEYSLIRKTQSETQHWCEFSKSLESWRCVFLVSGLERPTTLTDRK